MSKEKPKMQSRADFLFSKMTAIFLRILFGKQARGFVVEFCPKNS